MEQEVENGNEDRPAHDSKSPDKKKMMNDFVQNLALKIYTQQKSAAKDNEVEMQKKQISKNRTW